MSRDNCIPSLLISLIGLMSILGCDSNPPVSNQRVGDPVENELTGAEIVDAVVDRYENAESYFDKAVLYLTYRLDGKPITEPHPWSVAWNREGQFAADLFNAKIRNDGKRLSCYIFDIESGNIDNQHVLVNQQNFSYLLGDEIATHFLFGTSELPLDELEALKENQLVPPMLGFLESALIPDWLSQPDSTKRLPDDSTLGVDCYVIEIVDDNRTYLVWVEKQKGQIEKIQLPLQYLDSQILASDEISEIRFFVRYHDAVVDPAIEPGVFRISPRLASKTVSRFVTLPESLPCERLGKVVDEFGLVLPDGKRYKPSTSKAATVLLWTPGFNATKLIEQLNELARNNELSEAEFAVVLSDELVDSNSKSEWSASKNVRRALGASKLKSLFDSQLEFITSIGIKSVPVIAVFDDYNVIQYVQPIDQEEWEPNAAAAISRVIAGEDIALEMRNEYQVFLDQYHKQLAIQTARASSFADGIADGSPKISTKTVWINDELTNPNLIHVPAKSKRIFVLDGLQSVAEYNIAGELVNRKRLSIPTQTGINRLDSVVDENGRIYFLAYSLLGKQAFVFDDKWDLMFDFEVPGTEGYGGITNCQLVIENGRTKLFVSGLGATGLISTDASGEIQKIGSGPCRSFYVAGGLRYELDGEGRLVIQSKAIDEVSDWKFHRLQGRDGRCFGMAKNGRSIWQLFELNSNGVVWSKVVDLADNGTGELFVLASDARTGFATYLNAENSIEMIGHEMEFLTDSRMENPVQGWAMVETGGSRFLCVSDGKLVKLLEFTGDSKSIHQVSTDRRP